MYPLNPNPYTVASNVWANSTFRTNGIAAGYASNFWVANPDIKHGYVVTNGPKTSYNGMQLSLNRRFSRGMLFELNYTYGVGYQDQFYGFQKPYVTTEQNTTNSNGSEAGNVRHVGVANWMYQLPFGRGKKFLGNANHAADLLAGGWQVGGIYTMQDGFPLSAFCGSGAIQNNDSGCYPDNVGVSPTLPRSEQDPAHFFNLAAFVNRLPGGTQFRYGNLRVDPVEISSEGNAHVTVEVENIGKRTGVETVQLYVHERFTPVATPVKQLRGFERVTLEPGQKKTVTFTLGREDLRLLNRNMRWVVVPGMFDVMIGRPSADIAAKAALEVKASGLAESERIQP